MKDSIELRHIFDLANRSYNNNQYTFTDFLTIAEASDFYANVNMLPPCGYTVWGGYEGAERVMIRFGSIDNLSYEEDFPLRYVKIEPLMAKFAENLSHRDVLGSIMNLGMEREKLGDIVIKDGTVFAICTPRMAELITEELTRIRHTSVKSSVVDIIPEELKPQYEIMNIQVVSRRLDAMVAKLSKLSRGKSSELVLSEKVYINGRVTTNHSYNINDGDILSIRGYGKYRFDGIDGTTRKGNLIATISKYN